MKTDENVPAAMPTMRARCEMRRGRAAEDIEDDQRDEHGREVFMERVKVWLMLSPTISLNGLLRRKRAVLAHAVEDHDGVMHGEAEDDQEQP